METKKFMEVKVERKNKREIELKSEKKRTKKRNR